MGLLIAQGFSFDVRMMHPAIHIARQRHQICVLLCLDIAYHQNHFQSVWKLQRRLRNVIKDILRWKLLYSMKLTNGAA